MCMLDDSLPDRLADGMTYDDFQEEYGLDVLEVDTLIRDLPYDVERERDGDTWHWVLDEPAEAFDSGEDGKEREAFVEMLD